MNRMQIGWLMSRWQPLDNWPFSVDSFLYRNWPNSNLFLIAYIAVRHDVTFFAAKVCTKRTTITVVHFWATCVMSSPLLLFCFSNSKKNHKWTVLCNQAYFKHLPSTLSLVLFFSTVVCNAVFALIPGNHDFQIPVFSWSMQSETLLIFHIL